MATGMQSEDKSLVLVRDGRPNCAIVLREGATEYERLAASELQSHLERAFQDEVPIVAEQEAVELDDGKVRLAIGEGSLAGELGLDVSQFQEEEYAIKAGGNALLFVGRDQGGLTGPPRAILGQASPATLFAVYHFLDHFLGVRWLWPGETGTYVPRYRDLEVPAIDLRTRPALVQRRLQVPLDLENRNPCVSDGAYREVCRDAIMWGFRHLQGSRTHFVFSHSFPHWWEQYHEDHPDYFAVPPAGQDQPYPRDTWVKLCVSNPGVAETILDEWREAGRPNTWCVGPNDGNGWCTCANCRALDVDPDRDPGDIWQGGANLTGRYTALWNRLLKQMKKERPDVTLTCFAYSNYRDALPDTKLEDGMVLAVVHTYSDAARQQWENWAEAGARLYLRPNWYHMGGCAPHIPLHRAGGYFRFAQDRSMIGFKFDTVMGYWATQGPFYYLIGRLGTRPDLSVDDVIEEYCSAFGKAAPAIRKYLAFWENFTEKVAVPVPAGGAVTQDADGLYETACREMGIGNHPLHSSWRIFPPVYTDDVLNRGFAILDEADALDGDGDDPLVRERIAFLREGLVHVMKVRDIIDLAYREELPKEMSEEEVYEKNRDLVRYQAEITPRHVVWGQVVMETLKRRNVRTVPGDMPEPDLSGM